MKKAKAGEFEIEKGVSIPPKSNATGAAAVIRSLEVGDSVELPISIRSATRTAYHIYGSGHVVVRTTEKGCRIWRVK